MAPTAMAVASATRGSARDIVVDINSPSDTLMGSNPAVCFAPDENHEGRCATYTKATKTSSCRSGAIALMLISTLTAAAQVDDIEIGRAMTAARERAVAGDVVAQFSLGSVSYYGSGDLAQAVDWFRQAATDGFAPAEFQMGQLYDFGF